jgi:hypothetical protein
MNSDTNTRRITFNHPFRLPGMQETHRAGTFELVVEEIALDVSWEAYRMSCVLMLTDGGTTSAQPVLPADVEGALRADRQQDVKTDYS